MNPNFKRVYLVLSLVAAILLFACAKTKDFSYGFSKIKSINEKYNTTMESYPSHLGQIDSMSSDLLALKGEKLSVGQEALNELIDYRLLNLEAERLSIMGMKYGDAGTTKLGFGCKSRPLVIESAQLRNSSAEKGFEAVDLLRKFVLGHPLEASIAGLSNKNALFLNATFYQLHIDAISDGRTITHFCSENDSLQSYKMQFKKETNLSEDYLNNLTYEQAVVIWKRLEEI